ANAGLILDEKNRLRALWRGGEIRHLVDLGRGCGLFGSRKVDFEHRALSWFAFNVGPAAELLDHAVHNRETQPRTLPRFLGGEERLEHVGLDFTVHANAVIADDQDDVSAR